MVIILSSWAVIKIPMLFVEAGFLGIRFTLTRFVLTVPAILFMSLLVEKLVKKEEIVEEGQLDVISSLPNLNCGVCGYPSCKSFAVAVTASDRVIEDCLVLNKHNRSE